MRKKTALLLLIGFVILLLWGFGRSQSNSKIQQKVQKISSYTDSQREKYNLKYFNAIDNEYGFSIDFPRGFMIKDTFKADEKTGKLNSNLLLGGDTNGGNFIAIDLSAELLYEGKKNTTRATAETEYTTLTNKYEKSIVARELNGNWYYVSWKDKTDVNYIKEYVDKNKICHFWFKYNPKKKDYYEPMLEHIDKSYKLIQK